MGGWTISKAASTQPPERMEEHHWLTTDPQVSPFRLCLPALGFSLAPLQPGVGCAPVLVTDPCEQVSQRF